MRIFSVVDTTERVKMSYEKNPYSRRAGRVLFSILHLVMPMSAGVLDAGQAKYWKSLPLRRMYAMLLAFFVTISAWAFFMDLMGWMRLPLWGLLAYAALFGLVGTALFIVTHRRQFKLLPVIGIFVFAVVYFPKLLPRKPQVKVSGEVRQQVTLDALGMICALLLGHRLFVWFINTQGVEQIRAQTELKLAHEIQQTLVPPVRYESQLFEVYGITRPSEDVGGDLVDMISGQERALVYIADVSGHGIPAGVLMGNIKTALRFGHAQGESLENILDAINRVLPMVKRPEMYATFAGLSISAQGAMRYVIAGHPPIVHYRAASNTVERLAMQEFPLGLIPQCSYESSPACCGAGDVLLLLSDGIIETEGLQGMEFGFERVEQLLLAHAHDPLEQTAQELLTQVGKFGPRRDDQSVLLVRMLKESVPEKD